MTRSLLWLILAITQAAAGIRVAMRLVRTASGSKIRACDRALPEARVTAIVPALNEERRLAPCLEGLIAQPPEVVEILVVDGGSTDDTRRLAGAYAARDRRVRLIVARTPPCGWNGKAFSLQAGLDLADPACGWLLTVDADVRPEPALARSLLAHIRESGAAAVSVAPLLHLSGVAEAVVHPA